MAAHVDESNRHCGQSRGAAPATNDPLRQTDHMTEPSLSETREWAWLLGMLVLCSIIALVMIWTIPIVSELPEGTSSVAEYVVGATVARFGVPVVAFLFLASLMTALGHNKGDGRPGLDLAAKVCSFRAATFSLWAAGSAVMAIS